MIFFIFYTTNVLLGHVFRNLYWWYENINYNYWVRWKIWKYTHVNKRKKNSTNPKSWKKKKEKKNLYIYISATTSFADLLSLFFSVSTLGVFDRSVKPLVSVLPISSRSLLLLRFFIVLHFSQTHSAILPSSNLANCKYLFKLSFYWI